MKRIFAFLLTALLLISMAAVSVNADSAEASAGKLEISQTGGEPGETVILTYYVTGKQVKVLQISPAEIDQAVFDSDSWLIDAPIKQAYDPDGKVAAVTTYDKPLDLDHTAVYQVVYYILDDAKTDTYPIGYTEFTVKVRNEAGQEVALFDTNDPTVSTGFTTENGSIVVHEHSEETCIKWGGESDPSCVEYGAKPHWYCEYGGQSFTKEADGTFTLMDEDTYIANVRIAKEKHEADTKTPDNTPATCTEGGVVKTYYECKKCGKAFSNRSLTTEIAPATLAVEYLSDPLGHDFSAAGAHVEAKAASCDEAGNVEYWHCSRCNLNFNDEKGTTEIKDTVIPATGHDYDWANADYQWSEDHKTCTATAVCKNDDTHKFTETANATVTEKEPTCTEEGGLTSVAEFENENLETQTFVAEPATPALGHDLTPVAAKAETCEEPGNLEYWECSRCHALFSDAEGKTETTAEAVTIAAKGHAYQTPTYEWSDDHKTCTATTVCGNDDTHIITETVNATVTEKEPTCTEEGGVTSVAVFENELFEKQTFVAEPAIPALGHDLTHVEAKDAKCEEDGNVEHWYCSRCKLSFSDEDGTKEIKDTVIPAPGHDWSDWVVTKKPTTKENGLQVRTCSRCEETQEKEIKKLADESSLPTGFEKAMAYYREQQKLKKAADEAAAKKAAEEAAKKAAEDAAKAAEEAAKAAEAPAIADTWTNPFVDVAATDAYYDAVRYVNESELFKGVSDTEFAPHEIMNRAMFVTVLGRLAGVDPASYATSSFTDVDPIGTWNYAPYVEWAAQNGIVLGYGDGKFGPKDEITIEQAAVIIARYAKYIGIDTASEISLASFTDGDAVSEWAVDALAWAAENGIYIGMGGTLNPQGYAERALVAVMLYNFANVCEK